MTRARPAQILVPLDLAAKPTDACLCMDFYQQPQPSFHDRLFGPRAGATHRLPHQLVIDFDSCPHHSSIHLVGS
jgi:hypothetical protein